MKYTYYCASCRGGLGCKISQARIKVTTEVTIYKKISLKTAQINGFGPKFWRPKG